MAADGQERESAMRLVLGRLVPKGFWFMFRRTLISLMLVPLIAQSKDMTEAKHESESLMNAALPFAERMLQQHGEFFPYGAALDSSGKVVSVAGYDGRETPPSADVIRLLRQAFVSGAKGGKYRATALVYDVRVALPGSETKSDAIAVALDHKDGYSVVVYLPYRLEASKLVAGDMFAQKGAQEIFAGR
jgi:hypothetical protein